MPDGLRLDDFLDLDDTAQPKPTTAEPVGPLRRYGAAGLRALGGWVGGAASMVPSPVNTPLGALLGGAGELGAEVLEGGDPDWRRISAEAALAAIPGGKLIKAGLPLTSAIRSGIAAGGGEAMRELASAPEETPYLKRLSPTSIAAHGAFGGALGGVLGKFLGVPEAAHLPETTPTTYEVEPTIRPGGMTISGSSKGPKTVTAGGVRPIKATGPVEPPTTEAAVGPSATPYAAAEPAPYRASARRTVAEEAKAAKAAAKVAEEEAAAQAIAAAKEGRIAQEPAISESVSAPLPGGGRQRMTTRYAVPAEEAEAIAEAPLPKAGQQTFASQADATQAPPNVAEPPVPAPLPRGGQEEQLDLLNPRITPTEDIGQPLPGLQGLFRSPSAVTGRAYRLAQEAAGEPAQAPELAELHKVFAGGTPAELARETRMRTLSPQAEPQLPQAVSEVRTPTAAPEAPGPSVTASPVVDEQALADAAVRAARRGTPMSPENLDELRNLMSERGAVNPMLAARLGLGAVGAATGAAMDPEDRVRGAILGGTAGALAPTAVMKLVEHGAPAEAAAAAAQGSSTPRELASKIWQTLPQVQRFNYLADLHGLAANGVAGPWGAAIMGALEHGLAGNEAGWDALRRLASADFIKEYKNSFGEASQLLAQGQSRWAEGAAPGATEKILAAPGVWMTAGDVAARRILEQAGFPEDLARQITLTSEPWSKLGHQLMDVGRGSPMGQLLFPFKRTPINILEQGTQRIPGLGSIVQQARGTQGLPTDTLPVQAIQQGLGGALGLGAAAVSSQMDPEQERLLRRYAANIAGPYSLPVQLGMAAGQAIRADKPIVSGTVSEYARDIPVPQTNMLVELGKYLSGEGRIPSFMAPKLMRTVLEQAASAGDVDSFLDLSDLPTPRR